jgi:hypothetical protein
MTIGLIYFFWLIACLPLLLLPLRLTLALHTIKRNSAARKIFSAYDINVQKREFIICMRFSIDFLPRGK